MQTYKFESLIMIKPHRSYRLIKFVGVSFFCFNLMACFSSQETSPSPNQLNCNSKNGETKAAIHSHSEQTTPHSIKLMIDDKVYQLYESPASGQLYLTDNGINKGEGLLLTAHKMGFMVETYVVDRSKVGAPNYEYLLSCDQPY